MTCSYCNDSRQIIDDGGPEICPHCSVWCEACENVKDKGDAAPVGNYHFCGDCIRSACEWGHKRTGGEVRAEAAIYSLALRRFGDVAMVRAIRPHLTGHELAAFEHPIPCARCWERPALSGKGMNYCEACHEIVRPSRYREQDEFEQRMSDQMEASGASLEPSSRSAGGGLSRAWPGAKLADYDRSDE